MTYPNLIRLPGRQERFYKHVLKCLHNERLPFLIGGSLAMAYYMHLPRTPKDLDIFVRKEDCPAILDALAAHGYRTEILHGHWLAKAWFDDIFVDFIFCSGNGLARVDDSWFDYSRSACLFGVPVSICAPEDIVWSKAYIMDRERFDGADVAHLIRDAGPNFDWQLLLDRFGEHWRLLLSHLLLFQFIYPDEDVIPRDLLEALLSRAQEENAYQRDLTRRCQGTLLSRDQYLSDIELYGYADGRLAPSGNLSAEEVDEYTRFVREEKERLKQQASKGDATVDATAGDATAVGDGQAA